ncbi:uncharacterized protein TrAtP1_003024 [Trichoderma atroviride]|uniref:uncharacterized protein n=1 Tax=Hypocrea atroviridis TaxID=63577 RepID=UPI003325EE7B|nr:hypothetical protein TrAtP1_003024 [Trichoderma atroviride]
MAEQDGQSGGGADSQSRNTHLTLARDSGGLRIAAPSGICDDGAAKSLVDAFNSHLPRLNETSTTSRQEQVPTCATCLLCGWMAPISRPLGSASPPSLQCWICLFLNLAALSARPQQQRGRPSTVRFFVSSSGTFCSVACQKRLRTNNGRKNSRLCRLAYALLGKSSPQLPRIL